MSIQISIETYLDDAQARSQQAELEAKNDKIKNAIEANKKATREAYQQSVSVMRSSYMMISGISQVMGGGMGQIFSTLYGLAVAGITTYQSITAAIALVPGAQLQAGLMTMSLMSALVSLASMAAGQTDLASQVGGLNMTIQGIGGLLNNMNFS